MQRGPANAVIDLQRRGRAAAALDQEQAGVRAGLGSGGILHADGDRRHVIVCQMDRGIDTSRVDHVGGTGLNGCDDRLGTLDGTVIQRGDGNGGGCLACGDRDDRRQLRVIAGVGRSTAPGQGKIQGRCGGAAAGKGEAARIGGHFGGVRVVGDDRDLG